MTGSLPFARAGEVYSQSTVVSRTSNPFFWPVRLHGNDISKMRTVHYNQTENKEVCRRWSKSLYLAKIEQ